jgi:hypothetical protein
VELLQLLCIHILIAMSATKKKRKFPDGRIIEGQLDADGHLHGVGTVTAGGVMLSCGTYRGGQLQSGWEVRRHVAGNRALQRSLRGTFEGGELAHGRQSFTVTQPRVFEQLLRIVTEGHFDKDGELHGNDGTETISVVECDGAVQCQQTVHGSFAHGQPSPDVTVTTGGMYAGMVGKLPSFRNKAWPLRSLC